MKIVNEWPPNIEEIRKVLPVSSRNIFAYHDTIYNPGGCQLGAELVAHEDVHFRQQALFGGAVFWWDHFLKDKEFRLSQEIEAHREEYQVWCGMSPRTRNERRVMLKVISKRLAAPMYGGIISVVKAKQAIIE